MSVIETNANSTNSTLELDLSVADPKSVPLQLIDVSQPKLFQTDTLWPYFDRLRNEAPVHRATSPLFGPFWSITRFNDIMMVDKDHATFSSEGNISLNEKSKDLEDYSNFISMDPPQHDVQRNAVAGVVAPRNLAQLESIIRARVVTIVEGIPEGTTFDWVEQVSVELTTQMLATLFDFPFEDRRKLTRWSDVATNPPGTGVTESGEQRRAELIECLEYFTALWNERVKAKPKGDLISMLAHGEATKNMVPFEFLGNLLLLIVGGNDTTRNSISGGVLALNENPAEYAKLRKTPDLIPNMVSEIIRWQTPLAHMRRTTTRPVTLNGVDIPEGEKVVMWYVSGNRDESAIPRASEFLIDREKARQHLSFGFGIHRCMGNRLAEMQLRILWEEIQKRFRFVEVIAPPQRTYSTFVKGYTQMQVQLHPY